MWLWVEQSESPRAWLYDARGLWVSHWYVLRAGRRDTYDLGQSYLLTVYLIYSSTIMVIIVVTIVLWTSLFFLSLLSLLSGHLIVFLGHSFCLHSLIILSVDTLLFPVVYCPMYRTIAQTCISSVACTPWYCSSLNCSARCSITALLAWLLLCLSHSPCSCEYQPIHLCCSSCTPSFIFACHLTSRITPQGTSNSLYLSLSCIFVVVPGSQFSSHSALFVHLGTTDCTHSMVWVVDLQWHGVTDHCMRHFIILCYLVTETCELEQHVSVILTP